MSVDWHDEVKHALAQSKMRGSERMATPKGVAIALTLEPSGELRLTKRVPTSEKGAGSGRRSAAKRQDAAHLSIAKNLENSHTIPRAEVSELPARTFGPAAKRAVKNACGALKTLYGRRIVFATLTLAGSTDIARMALARHSGYVVELLSKWIGYHAPTALWIYKWEWQKNGALHLHAAIGCVDVLRLRALERGFKAYVYKLHEQLSRRAGVDVFERSAGGSWKNFPDMMRSNCQPVRKCVKRYMAKYITKAAGAAQGYCPARWWGQSRALRRAVGGLRLCTWLNIPSWAQAGKLWQIAARLLQSLSGPTFEYSCAFRPTDRTLLHYALETDVQDLYRHLRQVLVG